MAKESIRIYNELQYFRQKNGYSISELARKVGCRRETLSNLEHGRYNPSLGLALRICYELGCSVDNVFKL